VNGSTRVNLHCHSNCSDGVLAPEVIANRLVAAGVEYAALTDHDTMAGGERFREVLAHRGVGVISAVEMTTFLGEQEIHLLAYGIDPRNEELAAALEAVRHQNDMSVQGLVGSIRRFGVKFRSDTAPGSNGGGNIIAGRLELGDTIRLIHDAGGRAILAHPLIGYDSIDELEQALPELMEYGLDGIEAYYGAYPDAIRQALAALAEKHGLLVTAGTDLHDPANPENSTPAIDMPTGAWKQFRDALQRRATTGAPSALPHHHHHHFPALQAMKWRFVLRIVLPSLLALALFAISIFAIIIPAFEDRLMERKREMIRELTNSAWSILAEHEQDFRSGVITRDEAQRLAMSRVEGLRYGKEQKDYFWVSDMHPRMVMHPYRSDLNGQDVSGFVDARGTRVFVEFAELVKRRHEGYVEYYWQWKDDPQRIEPKESFVKLFEPWGWIIGTGIYIEDVEEEIGAVTGTLVNTLLGITGIMGLLLFITAQQSLRIERQRASGQDALRDWSERYRSLVEASSEGTAMILGGKCTYANRTLLEMLGYTENEFHLLDLQDVLPDAGAQQKAADAEAADDVPQSFEGMLRRKDGSLVECLLTFNRISYAGQEGLILIAKDLRRHAAMVDAADPAIRRFGRPADNVPLGIMRLQAGRGGLILEANRAARAMLGIHAGDALNDVRLEQFVEDSAAFGEIQSALQASGAVRHRALDLRRHDHSPRVAAVSAVAVKDEGGAARYYDVVLEDITDRRKAEADTEALVQRLQTSLLFLHEPITHFVREALTCDMNMPAAKAAAIMSRLSASAALVTAVSGDVIGIVTDRDLRERIVAAGNDLQTPLYRIMSSPLVSIDRNALIYEALLLMETRGVQHLAVTDESGKILSIIRNKELMQFPRYGSAVLTREIARAESVEAVAAARERLPSLVKALVESSSRSRNITRIITSVTDAATQKFVELGLDKLGPAPARFAFVCLGSQGREEQTLVTDQDNALIYESTGGPDPASKEYFQRLGRFVSESLAAVGYTLCPGGIMASNPKWSRPLSDWKQYFRHWITTAEPQELLEFNTFFDLRLAYGESELVVELRHWVSETMRQNPPFFLHLAQNTMLYRTPHMGLLGKIVSGGTDSGNVLNLKDAMLPVVGFARLYALREGIAETNTIDRLDRLAEKKVLTASGHEELVQAYEYLMHIRLRHQAEALREHRKADNLVPVRRLTNLEERMVKQMFSQISTIQKKISFDFLGGA
jgi:PAS domain S-box-containing protein